MSMPESISREVYSEDAINLRKRKADKENAERRPKIAKMLASVFSGRDGERSGQLEEERK